MLKAGLCPAFLCSINSMGVVLMRFVLLLIIPLLPAPSLAEIYKWIDDNGKEHYGDKPSDAAAIELDLKSGGIIDDSSGSDVGEELTREEKRQRLLDTLAEDRDERARIKDEQKQQKKK